MGPFGKLPWWIGFLVSGGLAGMSATAGQVLPDWLQITVFVCSALAFIWGVVAGVVHFTRDSPAEPLPATEAARRQAYLEHARNAFEQIGGACGTDSALGYEMALASIEPMLLLLKQDGIPIPRLRGDGLKLGILRAHRYLNLLHPALQIGDETEAKRRARKAVPLINAATEERLWRDVKTAFGPRAVPSSPRRVIAAPLHYNNPASARLPRYDDEHRGPAVTDAYELSACRIDLAEHSEAWPLPDNLPPRMNEFAERIPEDQRADWLRRQAALEEVDRLIAHAMRSGSLPIWVAPIGEPERLVAPSAMVEVDHATVVSGCYRPPNDRGWLYGRPLFVKRYDWEQFVEHVQGSKGVPSSQRGK